MASARPLEGFDLDDPVREELLRAARGGVDVTVFGVRRSSLDGELEGRSR